MTKIYKIKYSQKVLEKLIEKRFNNNDYEGVLSLGHHMIYKLRCESRFLYEYMAKANYKIEEYAKAINFWFLYLANCDELEKVIAYNALGACFYKMENQDIASYYFNKQLKSKLNRPYLYNDVLSEFYNDLTNYKDKYYIAYPYNKANFDMLLTQVINYIKAGQYEKALEELEIIPSDSKYYVEALIQKSICKYVIGKPEEALKDVSLAVKLDGDNFIALFNAISMFYASGKTAEMKKMLEVLASSKYYNNVENAEKIALIYCELKDYKMVEKFLDKALKKYPYKINLLLLNGITKFNLRKYDDALELFSKCNRLNYSYVNNYYIKLTKSAINKEKTGREIFVLDYCFDVQRKEHNRIDNRFNKFLEQDVIDKKNHRELKILFDYAYEKSDVKLLQKMLVILNKMEDDFVIRIALKYLLRVDMLDNVKRSLIALLVYKGFNNELLFVYGNIFNKLKILQPKFNDNCGILKESYSICISKLASLEDDILLIKKATDKVITSIENGLDASLLNDAYSLSAVLFEISNIKPIKSRRIFLDYFEANQRTVKRYKELINSFSYPQNEEFENLVKELEKLETEFKF